MDSGDELKDARAEVPRPTVVRANCNGKAIIDIGGNVVSEGENDVYPAPDQTLNTGWYYDRDGSHSVFAAIWTGRHFSPVLDDEIAATK